jgi:hypothetical protein
MQISLLVVVSKEAQTLKHECDMTLDDVRSILYGFCQSFDARSRFSVSGFGQETWPVDVQTDLPILLEQLPESIAALHNLAAITIDFYEQGIERKLMFKPSADNYEVTCSSATAWRPDPMLETIARHDLILMFTQVLGEFLRAMAESSPETADNRLVIDWLSPAKQIAQPMQPMGSDTQPMGSDMI